MKINIEKGNLFNLNKKEYHFVHCISSDCAMGAGIAVQFQKRFNLKNKLLKVKDRKHPNCILENRVFNLITKEKYWHKPTYDSLEGALHRMFELVGALDCNKECVKIAMPKIGSGLDRLQWAKVLEIINKQGKVCEDCFGCKLEIEIRYL